MFQINDGPIYDIAVIIVSSLAVIIGIYLAVVFGWHLAALIPRVAEVPQGDYRWMPPSYILPFAALWSLVVAIYGRKVGMDLGIRKGKYETHSKLQDAYLRLAEAGYNAAAEIVQQELEKERRSF